MTLTDKDINKVRQVVKEEISGFTAEVSSMKEEISGFTAEVSSMKDEMSGFTAEVSSMKDEITDIKETIHYMQENMLSKEDAKDFLKKKDAEKIAEHTSNLVMEKMTDQFRLFADKFLFIDNKIAKNSVDIRKNSERIDLNSMNILNNNNRIQAIEQA